MKQKRLKHVADVRVSNVDKKSIEGDPRVQLCNYTDVYYNERITDTCQFMEATATYDQRASFGLRKGDVVLTKDSETADDIGVSAFIADDVPGLVCGYHLAIVRAHAGRALGGYLRWVLSGALSRQRMSAAATGVTRFGLRSEAIGNLPVPVPHLATQRAIADYLDYETARIDGMISLRQRQVALLREGLDSGLLQLVNPRNKGVRQLPISRVLQKQSRAAPSLGVVTAFRNGLVTLRDRRRRDGFTESTTRSDYQGVKRGDVVFHGLDGFAGAIGVSEDDGICSPVYHVCATRPDFDSRYVALVLRALALSGFLALQSGNVRERAVDFRNWDSLGRIRIPVPSLDEQRTKANAYIDRRNWTDTLVDGLRRHIALLQEHRHALITAVVTGQLDISEAT
jgi:type I restriction enzyme, S subunit